MVLRTGVLVRPVCWCGGRRDRRLLPRCLRPRLRAGAEGGGRRAAPSRAVRVPEQEAEAARSHLGHGGLRLQQREREGKDGN
jgi:hypothetical protein